MGQGFFVASTVCHNMFLISISCLSSQQSAGPTSQQVTSEKVYYLVLLFLSNYVMEN